MSYREIIKEAERKYGVRLQFRSIKRLLPEELRKSPRNKRWLIPIVKELREKGLTFREIREEIWRRYNIRLSNGHLSNWFPRERRNRPRELLKELYPHVLKLHEMGYGIMRIIKEVERLTGERLSKSTVSNWIRGIHTPFYTGTGRPPPKSRRRFRSINELKPSPELAFIIGVVFGDGTVCLQKSRRYPVIRLYAKDREFVEEFARALGKVLERQPPKVIEVNRRSRVYYVVAVSDITLYELLRGKDIDRVIRFIEYNKKTMAAFLRGFFDSEGTVSSTITAVNTDVEKLKYVVKLLSKFRIICYGPRLKKRAGEVGRFPDGYYATKKDVHCISVSRESLLIFLREIGFTIRRKQQRLKMLVRERLLQKKRRRCVESSVEEVVEEEVILTVEVEIVEENDDVAADEISDEVAEEGSIMGNTQVLSGSADALPPQSFSQTPSRSLFISLSQVANRRAAGRI